MQKRLRSKQKINIDTFQDSLIWNPTSYFEHKTGSFLRTWSICLFILGTF
jgi:hypothetical protein